MKAFYQSNIYGYFRSGEEVTYKRKDEEELVIEVKKAEKTVSFTVKMFLPKEENTKRYPNGSPFIICMHPIGSKEIALENGYAIFFMDSYQIATDDDKHQGCFYQLYPYGKKGEEQTGVLMAWAWGASKVLDAVLGGLAKEVSLDPEGAMVTGVSRWGKATAVCGAFDERFRMVIPACSGAGGLANYGVISTGRTFHFEKIGGPDAYTYGENEPLSCLQSEAERGWFNDRFLEYHMPEEIPYNQEELVVLAAASDRYYFIIGAYMGEDWVNSPAMWECFKKALVRYRALGLEKHLAVHFHKEGHAVIEEDMKLLIDYFNAMKYNMEMKTDEAEFHSSVFDMV